MNQLDSEFDAAVAAAEQRVVERLAAKHLAKDGVNKALADSPSAEPAEIVVASTVLVDQHAGKPAGEVEAATVVASTSSHEAEVASKALLTAADTRVSLPRQDNKADLLSASAQTIATTTDEILAKGAVETTDQGVEQIAALSSSMGDLRRAERIMEEAARATGTAKESSREGLRSHEVITVAALAEVVAIAPERAAADAVAAREQGPMVAHARVVVTTSEAATDTAISAIDTVAGLRKAEQAVLDGAQTSAKAQMRPRWASESTEVVAVATVAALAELGMDRSWADSVAPQVLALTAATATATKTFDSAAGLRRGERILDDALRTTSNAQATQRAAPDSTLVVEVSTRAEVMEGAQDRRATDPVAPQVVALSAAPAAATKTFDSAGGTRRGERTFVETAQPWQTTRSIGSADEPGASKLGSGANVAQAATAAGDEQRANTRTMPLPVLQAPIFAPTNVMLRWRADGEGQGMRVQLAKDGAFAETVVDQRTWGNHLQFPRPPAGTYYLRLKSVVGDAETGQVVEQKIVVPRVAWFESIWLEKRH